MITRISKTVVAVLAAAGLAMSIAAGNASAATATPNINQVPCPRTGGEFLEVVWHSSHGPVVFNQSCFANAGTVTFVCDPGSCWLDWFSTGNNRVQWYGDGKWQPATPVGKWTVFKFPDHPGGVSLDQIRIL